MGTHEDFRLWEREIAAPDRPEHDRGGGEMLSAALLTAAGCAVLIALGGTVAGVAGLVVATLIIVLWRCGL
ncbi:hypothetical protein [Actinomadura atramentaria]|uniref:hypothetical protein n=1 Tax=Actinomadura atramentaria TaxID=1990 RepID=UPI00036B0E4C|nr:hypothetical protein [Actinomadura atramentaria]